MLKVLTNLVSDGDARHVKIFQPLCGLFAYLMRLIKSYGAMYGALRHVRCGASRTLSHTVRTARTHNEMSRASKLKAGFEIFGSHYLNWPITTRVCLSHSSFRISKFKSCKSRIANPGKRHQCKSMKRNDRRWTTRNENGKRGSRPESLTEILRARVRPDSTPFYSQTNLLIR